MGIKKVCASCPPLRVPARRRDWGGRTARASSRGPPADRPVLSPEVPFPPRSEPMRPSATVNLLLRSSRAVSAGMRKSERGRTGCGAGGWRESGRTSPARPPLARVWLTLLAGPRSASLRLWLPLRGGAGLGSGEGRGGGRPEPERVGSGPGGRAVSPGQSAPRHGRSAGGGNAGRAAAGPRRRRLPGRGGSGLGCPGLSSEAGGGTLAKGSGERPDRREGQGKLSARRRAAPVAKPPLPAPARWCTSLSFSLAHSLTSWLEIPTDVEREDRQTDTRAHAAGAGGGVAAGGGGSPHSCGGDLAPPARPRRPAPHTPLGAAAGRRRGARVRRPGRRRPPPPLREPRGQWRTGTPPGSARGADSCWEAGGAEASAVRL